MSNHSIFYRVLLSLMMAANQYPKDIFIQRIEQYKKSHTGRGEEFQRLAIFRLIIFIGTFIFVVYFANAKSFEGVAIAFGLGLTGFSLFKRHTTKPNSYAIISFS